MENKKLTVYIKANPSSMGFLQKLDLECENCDYYSCDSYPFCFQDKGCVVHEYMKEKLGGAKIEVNFDCGQKNNPKISAVSKNISDLNRSYQTVGRAIEIALGVVTQKKK